MLYMTFLNKILFKKNNWNRQWLCIICLSIKLSSLLGETKLYKNTRGKNLISNFRPYKSTYTENITCQGKKS